MLSVRERMKVLQEEGKAIVVKVNKDSDPDMYCFVKDNMQMRESINGVWLKWTKADDLCGLFYPGCYDCYEFDLGYPLTFREAMEEAIEGQYVESDSENYRYGSLHFNDEGALVNIEGDVVIIDASQNKGKWRICKTLGRDCRELGD